MNPHENRTARRLQAVYQSCLESENGYRLALREARDPDLRSLFSSYSLQKAHFGRQLREALGPRDLPPLTAEMVADFLDPEAVHPGRSSEVLLGDCAGREQTLIVRYTEALAADPSGPVRELLDRQLKEVEAVSERIRQLRELAEPL